MASSNLTSENPEEDFNIIRICHDEAFLYVSQGLSYQEQKQPALAHDMYNKGLEKINKALNVRCDRPYCIGPNWDSARKMQQKMRKTMQMIQSQLNQTSAERYPAPRYEPLEMPPTYDEACEHGSFPLPRRASYPDINNLNGISANQHDLDDFGDERTTAVVELFGIESGVQLFYVSASGSVSTASTFNSLHIYKFVDNDDTVFQETTRPPAWLEVGSWTYPLIPGQSPALESGYGAFLFPDVGSGEGSVVGVILPSSVDHNARKTFENILSELTAFEDENKIVPATSLGYPRPARSQSFSDTLSRGIVTGAEYLSAGLVKGASMTSVLIHKGATKVREHLNPDDKPVIVDPRLKEGLKIARNASGVALKASGFLVRKLGDLTLALGKQIAPHLRQQGTKVLTGTFKTDADQAQSTVDGVLTVAAGGLQGFSTVYMGLENAARTLAYSLSTETVNIVGHKYGDEAGEVVSNAVFAVGNLALTTHNVQALGVKSIAKRTAKDAGKSVLKDYVEHIDKTKQ